MKTKSKKILLVSGCSWSDNNFNSIFHPSLDCSWTKWPELLAKKLDMICVNLSFCGSGQEYIFSSLIEYLSDNKNNIGLIISAWSRAPRRDYQLDEKWRNVITDVKGDEKYFTSRSLRYYYIFQIFCERFNLPYKQVQMISDFDKRTLLNYNLSKQVNEKHFIGWPIESKLGGFSICDKLDQDKHFISKQDRHPNAEGQKLIAEIIYENI